MPSPFPGMDPFLEDTDIYPGFQRAFIVYLSEVLLPALKEPYLCDIRNRVWYELPDDERREPFVEIYVGRRPDRQVVTTIELLTATTKTPGEEGRELYLQKRRNVMGSEINLVEIDLLRGGVYAAPLPMELLQRQAGAHDYRAVVWRYDKPQQMEVYPFLLQHRMPVIQVPLLPREAPVVLDLQAVFNRCYDAGPYAREIDYQHTPPDPPLTLQQIAWMYQLLRRPGFAS